MNNLYLISTDYQNLTKVRTCKIIKELKLENDISLSMIEVDIPIFFYNNENIKEGYSTFIIKPRGYNYTINEKCSFPIYINIYSSESINNCKNIKDLKLLLTADIYFKYEDAKKWEDKMKIMGRALL